MGFSHSPAWTNDGSPSEWYDCTGELLSSVFSTDIPLARPRLVSSVTTVRRFCGRANAESHR